MAQIVADPLQVSSFLLEHSRLSASLHSQLGVLKSVPSPSTLRIFENNAAAKLGTAIAKVSIAAYHKAVLDVGGALDLKIPRQLSKDALERATLAASFMARSSREPLEIESAISKKRVASKERAEFASRFELRNAFFLGTTRGWELNKRSKKMWLLSSRHDKDDICDENAEQGPISVFDFFISGHMFCPAHFGCLCTMALILPQDNRKKK